MFFFLSKFLPSFTYPLGLACLLLLLVLLLRRWPKIQTGLIAATLVILFVGGNRLVSMALTASLEERFRPLVAAEGLPHAQAIVVLGGATRAPLYPRQIPEINEPGDRLLYAAWLYQQGVAPQILLSGGHSDLLNPDSPTEAESMAELLMLMGVPEDALILEGNSINTYQNFVESRQVLNERGLDDIILITSATHMPRAYRIFSKSSLKVTPAPTDFQVTDKEWAHYTQANLQIQLLNLVPSAENLLLTSQALKEYFGLVVYVLRGWA